MTEIIKRNETPVAFVNPVLTKATEKIFNLGETVRKCAYETASIMDYVDTTKSYLDDGFKSVHEWAMKTFGFKKSASYSLLRIGREYTQRLVGDDGKTKGFRSSLPTRTENDFTVSQIEKMLPLEKVDVLGLVSDGDITPDMTCKEIEKVVKEYRKSVDESENSEVPESKEVVNEDSEVAPSDKITMDFTIDRELGVAVYNAPNGMRISFKLVHLDKFLELVRHTGQVISD